MIVLELFLISVVIGSVLGVAWRKYEEKQEKELHKENLNRQINLSK